MTFENQLQAGIAHLSKNDPILRDIIAVHPLPGFSPHKNYYDALVSSIIGQQLSIRAAVTIRQRFLDLFDRTFPAPDQIIAKDVTELRAVGLSLPKAKYIQDLAHHVLDGTVQFDQLDSMTNEEIITSLTAVKGIGEWTVHMFLMFCMGRLDVLPVGDLGIRNSIRLLYLPDKLPSPAEVAQIADEQHWQPYATIASWYLWRSLDNET